MDHDEGILRLLSINQLGPRKCLILTNKFDSIEAIFKASYQELIAIDGFSDSMVKEIKQGGNTQFLEEQLTTLQKGPFEIITIFDNYYPEHLFNIYDPPPALFIQGNFSKEDHDAIAFVGTRKCSKYGKQVTEKLVKELVKKKITIVSGFARGIDTTAHRAALKNGGRTIAVLGNGIDKVYPPENRDLRTRLVKNGVYCSEFPFHTQPEATNFPRRNRIISGLSLGTVVIEAGKKSGSLITANYSINQNRETFAVPGKITSKTSRGTNNLIQEGAKPALTAEDILEEIEALRKYPEKKRQLEIDFTFTRKERQVYDLLTFDPVHIDDLASKTDSNTQDLLSTLLSLELKGAAKQYSGKLFAKIGNFQ